MQHITHKIREAFGPVEQVLQDAFILDLFMVMGKVVPRREFNRLPVKQAGLVLPDPTKTAPENWMTSYVITGHLVAVLRD